MAESAGGVGAVPRYDAVAGGGGVAGGATPSGGAVAVGGAVPTVAGAPLAPGVGTMVDGHAHAWIDPPDGVAPEHALRLADEDLQAAALRDWAVTARSWAQGGDVDTVAGASGHAGSWRAGLIDCQPPFAGRNANALARISRRSRVAIACVTGFHRPHYYPDGKRPWADASDGASLFAREIEVGLVETPERRAAAIKAALGSSVDDDLAAWEAAVEAQRRTGACLLVHTERGAGVVELVAWLADRGVPQGRVYLCHVDKRPDLGLHAELAGAGVLLGYDTFLRPRYSPDENVWPLLTGMIALGFGSSIAVGLDLALAEQWRHPHPGPAGLISAVATRLEVEIGDDDVVAGLMGGNVLRALVHSEPEGAEA